MKKFISVLLFTVVCWASFAQPDSEHLTFKGVPIEGSMTGFCQKLKEKGLNSVGSDGNITILLGDFAGRNATVGVVATDDGKNVCGVVVMFDSSDEWNTLVNTYDYYKNLYIRKYGEPAVSLENNPAHSDSNTALMAEVYKGTVVYGSAWKVAGGDIELSIEKSSGFYEGKVVIRYRDSQNMEVKMQSELEDI